MNSERAHSTVRPLRLSRWTALAAGIACAAAAIVLLIEAGLPNLAETEPLSAQQDAEQIVAPVVGALAPPIRLQTIEGRTVDLESYRDHVVVINSWATWCVPCAVEMPALQQLAERYPATVTVLGLNAGDTQAQVAAWRDRFGLTFDLLLDPEGIAERDYRLRGQPTTFIVAPGGRIEAMYFGPVDLGVLERTVLTLLDPASE